MTENDETPGSDDIAVVGMAGRFPGARDVEEFWGNLRAGVESVSFFSVEELVAAGVPREVAESPSYVGAGSEVEGVDEFDADFFGYTAFEAQLMDPQHRLFLESAWSALESAGYDSDRFGGRIGVFGGNSTSSAYLPNIFSNMEAGARIRDQNVGLGFEVCYLTTRVSYKMNLRGPSLPVQTACSTSLVALHLACQSLLGHECDMALTGASAFKSHPGTGYLSQPDSVLSPDGHCRPFDVGAAGTVFGSGVGVVVLRRLEDALAAGDSVLAVVKGSAVNNDGAVKASFTAPSVGGQAAVVAEALASAGVDASSIGYVEAHGTGTLLGDPIEVRALTQAFRGSGSSGGVGFCGLGSLKSNVGHLDAAAGIAGLVKAIQALRYEELPPTVNFSAPNPEIDFGSSPFRVVERLEAWPRSGVPRRAGVSAFGFGGTNAHVIVEEAPVGEVPVAGPRDGEVLVLSARSEAALEEMSDQLAAALDAADGSGDKGGFLGDVSFTLAVGRREFPFRRVVVAPDPRAAAVAIRERDPGRVLSHYLVAPASGVAFLFSGQGAQYSGMAAGLYRHEPVFAAAVDECAGVLNPVLDVDLRDLIFAAFQEGSGGGARGELSQTQLAQPALFTVEYALAVLLRSWGIIPEAMLGHSLGEYVAACLAGVFDLRSALGLVALRGRLMQAQCPGSMLSIAASLDETRSLLADFTGQSDDSGGRDLVALAAHNGPRDCVVSGPSEAVGALEEHAAQLGFTTAGLDTSHAFHSPLMEPMVEEFRAAVAKVELHSPAVPFVSNVTGTWITGQQATDPGYWAGHIRSTVQFAAGLATLTSGNDHTLLEIGPGQTLASLARRAIKTPVSRSGSDGGQPAPARLITHTLPHRKDPRTATHTLQRTLGQLWTHGHTPDWTSYWTGQTRHRIPLPTYPFQRRRHWLNQATPIPTTHETTEQLAPLLDDQVVSSLGESTFATHFSADRHWVLSEHRLLGEAIVPGTTYLEMARSAAALHLGRDVTEISEVDFLTPLVVPHGQERLAHTRVRDVEIDRVEFRVVSCDPAAPVATWTEHIRGQAAVTPASPHAAIDVGLIRRACDRAEIDVEKRQVEHDFMQFGPRWVKSLSTVSVGIECAIADLHLADEFSLETANLVLHPALVDLATGISGFAVVDDEAVGRVIPDEMEPELFLPVAYDLIRIYSNIPAQAVCVATPHPGYAQTDKLRKIDVSICNQDGALAVEVLGFTAKRVTDPEAAVRELAPHNRHHVIRWVAESAAASVQNPDPGRMLIVHDGSPSSAAILEVLLEMQPGLVACLLEGARPEDIAARVRGSAAQHLVCLMTGPAAADPVADGRRLFELAKAVATAPDLHLDRMSVVARLVERVSGTETSVSPEHASLFGLTRVIPQEIEGLAARTFDVDDATNAATIAADLAAGAGPAAVAYRGGRRWQAELSALEPEPSSTVVPEDRSSGTTVEDGVVLITGGLGGLGLAVAQHLSRTRPGVRLALLGRTPPPPIDDWDSVGLVDRAAAQVSALRDISDLGVSVSWHAVDVTDEVALGQAVSRVRDELGRITCVIHAAGVAGDGFIFRKEVETYEAVTGPKVRGVRLLDRITADDPPGLMVLFASTVGVFGAAGQADYTAANAFLDTFAVERSMSGRATTAIDWSDWLDVGMAADNVVERDQGFFRSLTVRTALASLDELLDRPPVPRVIVGEVNLGLLAGLPESTLRDRLDAAPLRLSDRLGQSLQALRRPAQNPASDSGGSSEPNAVVPAGRDNGTYSGTERRLVQIWGRELDVDELNIYDSSFDLGGNSLMALRIAQSIEHAMDVRVRMAELFRYVTVAELAEYIDNIGNDH